jgi:hypothetical protein
MMRFTHWNGANPYLRFASRAIAVALLVAGSAGAQVPPGAGQVYTPESSIQKPGDTGVRAHTNVEVFTPNRGANGGQALPGSGGPGAAGSPSPQTPDTNGVTIPAHPQ